MRKEIVFFPTLHLRFQTIVERTSSGFWFPFSIRPRGRLGCCSYKCSPAFCGKPRVLRTRLFNDGERSERVFVGNGPVFSTLNHSSSRNHLNFSRCFRQWTEIWRTFLRSAVLSAGKSCVPFSKYLSIINSNGFWYSCMVTLQILINASKCEFHSWSCLAQEDTAEKDTVKDVA